MHHAIVISPLMGLLLFCWLISILGKLDRLEDQIKQQQPPLKPPPNPRTKRKVDEFLRDLRNHP